MVWSRLAAIRSTILSVFGFASFIVAAFLVHIVCGFVVLGVCLLLLEYLQPRTEVQRA